jgi:hypothetical protein
LFYNRPNCCNVQVDYKESRINKPDLIISKICCKAGAYPRVEHLKGASFELSPAITANIRLGWKGLRLRPEPTRVKHLSGAPLKDRLLALPKNISLGWKGLPGTNALAYYEKA